MFGFLNKIVNSRVFKLYEVSLAERPIVTKSLTGTVVFGIGDICAQKIEKKEYDVKRTLMMCTIGTFIIVPHIHVWFGFLDRNIKTTGWRAAITKVALDQTLFAPYLFTVNISCVQIFKNGGFSFELWKEKMSNEFIGIYQKSLMIWPATNLLLFRYIPPQFRLLISNLVGAGWNCILSTVANNDNYKQPQPQQSISADQQSKVENINPQIQL
ncbi:hypothetical protein DICPUDRAFT_37572 [Dictyostelium purpureum]|uniref:Pmp22 family protein n=1 Tax=Dictyostelium purpureum TaxID=5786 RepID=F0ZT09_DICPU|nr:uncharacterized protein DICPUDRAFT_37572 [Dictyostelium purpureum]EGC32903.1 hypothetical protein DICPUDRAFT_37572 [Dictyostelium purpureum]|eukprot:XP_003290551.1 hypothetical protein DICPUDRAFT_37572 [Dictyostelium purpureum]